jgi:predicted SprT family Zn-dependent metalloprotease
MQQDLAEIFARLNGEHFDGFLDIPVLRWNARLRTSAGRFVPGSRRFFRESPPIIEIASYLREEPEAARLIADTIAHEMIHYWLWVRRRPYGHTEEFLVKMRAMGVSRYNPVPRKRPYRYVYACDACAMEFFARRKLGVLACAKCCKLHAGGFYDPRFRLRLARKLEAGEGLLESDRARGTPERKEEERVQ